MRVILAGDPLKRRRAFVEAKAVFDGLMEPSEEIMRVILAGDPLKRRLRFGVAQKVSQ